MANVVTYSDETIIKYPYLYKMMWRWRSTCIHVGPNVAYYNSYIHDRMWHFPSAKSIRLIALVTIRITAGANPWGDGK